MENNDFHMSPDLEVRRKNIENREKLSQQYLEKDRVRFVNKMIKSYNDGKDFVFFRPRHVYKEFYCTKLNEVMGDKIEACCLSYSYLLDNYELVVRFKNDS